MPVETLHEAALVLQGAYQAIEKLLDETEPLEREYLQRTNILLNNDPDAYAKVEAKMADESGYSAFYDAASRIIELLNQLDETSYEETRRALGLPA